MNREPWSTADGQVALSVWVSPSLGLTSCSDQQVQWDISLV